MQVRINDSSFDYHADFKPNSAEWKVKLKDAFRISRIGGTDCFIKRFADKPLAYDLLISLKGKAVTGMPAVYDLVTETENNKTIYYLFLECIKGNTLRDHIQQNKPFDITGVLKDVLNSLHFIHNNGYWFTDLNEENIFCSEDGAYLLIDVDSCCSNDIKPGTDITLPGGMPGAAQEYANIVMLFYKEILGMPGFQYRDIEGKNLNCVQLLALIAKLKVYLDNKKGNAKTNYANKKLYRELHQFILNKNEVYSKAVFSKALKSLLDYSVVLELGKFITGENRGGPAVAHFSATSFSIYAGNETTLLWKVENADEIRLSSEGAAASTTVAAVSSLSVKPVKTETYIITASNSAGQKDVKKILIDVVALEKPKIKYFHTAKYKTRKGRPVNLSWSVENASAISVNGTVYDPSVSNLIVYPEGTSEYTIIAENKAGENATGRVTIQVTSFNWWLLILAILAAAFIIWQVIVTTQYNSFIADGDNQVGAGYYDKAIDDYQAASGIAGMVLFGKKPNLYYRIKDANGQAYKRDGESLLTKGYILSDPYSRDSSALNSFQQAAAYIPDDTLVVSRIAFCDTVLYATKALDAEGAYRNALYYGEKTRVPQAALDSVSAKLMVVATPHLKFIDSVKVEHNVFQGEQKGMIIHFAINITNMAFKACKFVVEFYKASGEVISSENETYKSANGNLIVSKDIIPPFQSTDYKDIALFIPYNEFHLYDDTDLIFYGALFANGEQIGENSKKYSFKMTFTKN